MEHHPHSVKADSVLVVEGIPQIPAKLVERIRGWCYVDLADLLSGVAHKQEDSLSLSEDRIILVQSVDQVRKKSKRIGDIATWSQAYAILVAVLVSAEATTKEEAAGLLAHMQVVIQLCKDLGSLKWLQYHQQYPEWAAASGKRVWVEVNLSIYGRCLCTPTPSTSEREMRFDKPQTQSKKEPVSQRGRTGRVLNITLRSPVGDQSRSASLTMYAGTVQHPTTLLGTALRRPREQSSS